MLWSRLIIVSTMAWTHCGHSMSCPHEYYFFPHQPNPLFSLYTDILPPPLLVLSCLSPTWWPLTTLHPAPLPWVCISGFCNLSHLRLLWPPPYYLCPYWWGWVGFVTWSPSCTTDSTAPISMSIWWGVVVLIPGPPRVPPEFSFYVCPGGYWIKMVRRPLLDYVDNLSLALVMEEWFC